MKRGWALLWHLAASLCRQTRARDLLPPPAFDEAIDNGTYGYYPTRSYPTAPDLRAPETNFLRWSPECDDGLYYFLTPRGWSLPDPGPMILDRRGELVWAHHFENQFGGQAYDFMVQTYKGEDYLTFWLGDDRVRGHGAGSYYLLNSKYDIVHKIGAANGLSADLHEFLILPSGTALMTLYEIVPGDVSDLRTFDHEDPEDQDPNYVWDCVFQEVDIETGDALFEWRASDYYNITDTYRDIGVAGTKNDPFDWYHINSIVKDDLDNYLISARYPHSLTYIDGRTKQTIWQLGGKQNMFMDLSEGNATNFAWQHDARFVSPDMFPNLYTPPELPKGYTVKLLTLFDNAAEDLHYDFGLPLSRGLLLEVIYPTPGTERAMLAPRQNVRRSWLAGDQEVTADEKKIPAINGTNLDYTVRVIKSYDNPDWIRSSSQGSMQILPQDNGRDPKIFIGYGLNAAWTEFDAEGNVLCDVHFGARTSFERGDIQSYRGYKLAWKGEPTWQPSIVITDDDSAVLVSWNGATEVAEWLLQCATAKEAEDDNWEDVKRVPKHKFETAIPVPGTLEVARFVRVVAFSEKGTPLEHGVSKVVDRGIMASYFPSINKQLSKDVAHMSAFKFIIILACNVSAMFILYEVYRKYLGWRRHGGGAGGPLMFRKRPVYRLLGNA